VATPDAVFEALEVLPLLKIVFVKFVFFVVHARILTRTDERRKDRGVARRLAPRAEQAPGDPSVRA
jgi:biopolymer transport protein ExbD